MTIILNNYEVNQHTMALLSVAHIDYATVVMEQNRQLFIKKAPLEIIKTSCLEGGSTYDGRRKAVTHLTGAKQKVPIPINPRKSIFAFPTLSPSAFHCNWIFYNHVKFIQPNNLLTNKTASSIITFKNDFQLSMNESLFILQKQMQRTAMCILSYTIHPHDTHNTGGAFV